MFSPCAFIGLDYLVRVDAISLYIFLFYFFVIKTERGRGRKVGRFHDRMACHRGRVAIQWLAYLVRVDAISFYLFVYLDWPI